MLSSKLLTQLMRLSGGTAETSFHCDRASQFLASGSGFLTSDPDRVVVARSTAASCGIETPSVQCADEIVAVNFTKYREVSIPVRTPPLHNKAAYFDLIVNLVRRQLCEHF